MAKILIVDDAKLMRNIIRLMLEKEHEVVAEVSNGVDAHSAYIQFSPDVITMDIKMPESDGIEGLRLITRDDPQAAKRVIVISAIGTRNVVDDTLQFGVQHFLVKPVAAPQLLGIVEKIHKELGPNKFYPGSKVESVALFKLEVLPNKITLVKLLRDSTTADDMASLEHAIIEQVKLRPRCLGFDLRNLETIPPRLLTLLEQLVTTLEDNRGEIVILCTNAQKDTTLKNLKSCFSDSQTQAISQLLQVANN